MKKDHSGSLTAAQEAELRDLADIPDDQINTRDIPEQQDWNGARRGVFFRPIKRQLTLRLDADIIEWFKAHAPNGDGYQTQMNTALREYLARHSDERPAPRAPAAMESPL